MSRPRRMAEAGQALVEQGEQYLCVIVIVARAGNAARPNRDPRFEPPQRFEHHRTTAWATDCLA